MLGMHTAFAVASRLVVWLCVGLLLTLPLTALAEGGGERRDREDRQQPSASRRSAERDTGRAGADRGRRAEHRRERYLDNLPPEERKALRKRMEKRRKHRERETAPDRKLEKTSEHVAPGRRGPELRKRLEELPPEDRERMGRRLRRFRDLPEDEQREMRERYRDLRGRSPEERQRLRENSRRWREMPSERRDELREQMRRLRALPPAERQRVVDQVLGSDPE